MSPTAGLESAVALLTKLHDSPSLTHDRGAALIEEAMDTLRSALEGIVEQSDYAEKGLAEWRAMALSNSCHAEAARATARVAIGHLQAVLLNARTHDEQQRADTAARDWLASIGAD